MQNDTTIRRREAMAALGLGTIAAGAAFARSGGAQEGRMHALGSLAEGYDPQKGEYVLPPLPYAYDALEPHIDEQTMRIHHDRHHAGYVRSMNQCLQQLQAIRSDKGDPGLIEYWSKELTFASGGHYNHTLFWKSMSPTGGGAPNGAVAEAIEKDFGSFDKFAWQFRQAANSVEGSGWAWLVHEPMGDRLMIVQMGNQQNWMPPGATLLLGADVWEHAYYLKYQNRRSEYVEAFMKVVNWAFVDARLSHARR